jgi:hypothetical protein
MEDLSGTFHSRPMPLSGYKCTHFQTLPFMNKKAVPWIVVSILAVVCLPSLVLSFFLGYQRGGSTLSAEKTAVPQIAGMSREAVLQMFPGKQWYVRWENKNTRSPVEISVADDGQIFVGDDTHQHWTLELRWVLNEGGHLFIPIDDYTVHGFFIKSGRQKGLFAEEPKP